MGMIIKPFGYGPTIIDGTQGSTNSSILAGAMWSVSGTTVTEIGTKNCSISRLAAGTYRVTFTSALANTNYGVLVTGKSVDGATDRNLIVAPNRNSSSGYNSYSTAQVDILFLDGGGTATDPEIAGIVVFDPDSIGGDYLAACSVTISGTTPTLQRQTNVTSITRQAAGVYTPAYTSTLGNSDYSTFGSQRFADFGGNANSCFARNRNSTGPINRQSTSLIDLSVGYIGGAGSFDGARFGALMRNSDVAPRGTVAACRFEYSGGSVTLGKQWNVSSVSRQTTGCFAVNFTTALSDANYMVFTHGKIIDSAGSNAACTVGMNANSSGSRNVHSVNAVHIYAVVDVSAVDPEFVDVWVLKPWLM